MANFDLLVVAGGGKAASNDGGGGAGEVLYLTNETFLKASYDVIVGDRGDDSIDGFGEDSEFDTYKARGGGKGNSGDGGSGAGAGSRSSVPAGDAIPYQGFGNPGGIDNTDSPQQVGAGGGGGAGSAGKNSGVGSTGGDGVEIDITGTNEYYGAGGGGWQNFSNTSSNGTGHGNYGDGGNGRSADGVSSQGVVIIRFLTSDFHSTTGGTKTTDGDYTVHTFTSDGTLTLVAGALWTGKPSVSNDQGTSLEASAEINNKESSEFTKRGFVYSTAPQSDPGNTAPGSSSYSDNKEETGIFSPESYTLNLTGLSRNTTYYIRAYAYNDGDTGVYSYSEEIQYITADTTAAATILTNAISLIGEEIATGNGNITDVGDSNPTERGFVWGDESVTLPGNVAPEVTGYTNNSQSDGDFTAGTFTGTLTNLKRGRKYYVRAWAKNEVGYRYGNEVSFTTLDNNNDDIASTTLTNEDTSSVSLTNET